MKYAQEEEPHDKYFYDSSRFEKSSVHVMPLKLNAFYTKEEIEVYVDDDNKAEKTEEEKTPKIEIKKKPAKVTGILSGMGAIEQLQEQQKAKLSL